MSAVARGDAVLPQLVRNYVARTVPASATVPAVVRVRQTGEMWQRPGAEAMRFEATEDVDVAHVAFVWRARFPLLGSLALTVVDELARESGQLRVSLLGLPLRTTRTPETTVGQVMRYLSELAWAPPAIAANRELEWRELDESSVEVSCTVNGTRVAVRWQFDEAGDVVGATGTRPYPAGKTFVPTPWGGDFGRYERVGGLRVPTAGEAWWLLSDRAFVYWRGRVTSLELVGAAS